MCRKLRPYHQDKIDSLQIPSISATAIRNNNKLRYSSDYQWYLHNWGDSAEQRWRHQRSNDTYVRARGFPFEGKDFDALKDAMVVLPKADRNKAYLESVNLSSIRDYDVVQRNDRSRRIRMFNPLTELLEIEEIKEQFEMPETAREWLDRFERIDIERWLRWLEILPDIPDFGLSDEVEARIEEILEMRLPLSCEGE